MTDHADLFRLDAEPLRDAVLQPVDELARLVDRQLIAGPHAGGGEQLDRIVVLRRRAVFRIDLDVGAADRRLGIAGLRQILVLLRDFGRIFLLQALRAEGRGRRLRRIGHFDSVSRFARGLEGVGEHHRDDLAVLQNVRTETLNRSRGAFAELHRLQFARIFVGQDVEHAGHRARVVEVEPLDAPLGDRAGHQDGIGRIGDRHIGRIARLAGDLQPRVVARRGRSHVGLRSRRCCIRHLKSPVPPPVAARGSRCVCQARS